MGGKKGGKGIISSFRHAESNFRGWCACCCNVPTSDEKDDINVVWGPLSGKSSSIKKTSHKLLKT